MDRDGECDIVQNKALYFPMESYRHVGSNSGDSSRYQQLPTRSDLNQPDAVAECGGILPTGTRETDNILSGARVDSSSASSSSDGDNDYTDSCSSSDCSSSSWGYVWFDLIVLFGVVTLTHSLCCILIVLKAFQNGNLILTLKGSCFTSSSAATCTLPVLLMDPRRGRPTQKNDKRCWRRRRKVKIKIKHALASDLLCRYCVAD